MKKLVINADDFGYTPGVNRGVIKAHADGVVTAASLMTRGRAASEVTTVPQQFPELSLGLHFQIYDQELQREVQDGKPLSEAAIALLKKEFEAQLQEFGELIHQKPVHVDSHHHVLRHPALASFAREYAEENRIPLREHGTNFIEDFFGLDSAGTTDLKRISPSALLKIIDALPEGTSELMCHPGIADEALKETSSYTEERETEVETLTDPEVISRLKAGDVQLGNWTV